MNNSFLFGRFFTLLLTFCFLPSCSNISSDSLLKSFRDANYDSSFSNNEFVSSSSQTNDTSLDTSICTSSDNGFSSSSLLEEGKLFDTVTFNEEAVNYIFITDLHIDSDSDLEKLNSFIEDVFVEINDCDSIDFVCLGGDLTTLSFDNKKEWKEWVGLILEPFKKLDKPLLILNGNHDDNSNSSNSSNNNVFVLEPSDWIDTIFLKYIDECVVADETNDGSKYYYFELEKQKCKYRVICLDSNDRPYYETNKTYWGFSKEQKQWLEEQALVGADYYLFLSHMPINQEYNGDHKTIYYSDDILKLLEDFNKETNSILVNSFGHMHLSLFTKVNGIYYTCTPTLFRGGIGGYDGSFLANELNNPGLGWETKNNNDCLYSFDVFSVSPTRTIKNRIGY